MRPKPKVLIDIKSKNRDSFTPLIQRVNLTSTSERKASDFIKRGAAFSVAAFVPLIFLGYVFAPVTSDLHAQTISSAERETLEQQLRELEAQIVAYEKTIDEYKKQGKTLKGEIQSLNAKISKINLEIKATLVSLAKLDGEIKVTTTRIKGTETEIAENRVILSEALENLYQTEDKGLFEVLLENPKLSDFFGSLNDLITLQDNLRNSLEKLRTLKTDLEDSKEKLDTERADVAALKTHQDSQRRTVEDTRREKDNLLKVTSGKESEYQKRLTETRKTAAEIRNRIFELLGGGQLTFEQAYEFAKFAENATGVRAAVILAVLDRESALGSNVGRCKYDQINPLSGTPTMHPTRDTPIFLELTAELGLSPSSVFISCANRDGTYGGAMGPAQFLPSTWNIYKSRIASITGNNPSSPWRNADAFVATALYLRDAGAAKNEQIAAAKYYCGARWNRYVCMNVYGKKVVERARQFQADIDILNS